LGTSEITGKETPLEALLIDKKKEKESERERERERKREKKIETKLKIDVPACNLGFNPSTWCKLDPKQNSDSESRRKSLSQTLPLASPRASDP